MDRYGSGRLLGAGAGNKWMDDRIVGESQKRIKIKKDGHV